ncbi:MAG: hypothetical protein HN352_14335 [Bacteroidetes bacterium]|nr:hypothetical protein [Bacteroidota bacterium]MBT3751096.1 hypothetical protein [Bacteroidota bacterium]MBT4397887.1 hypothetical protein [Bacteroidota bacterium]MBT4411559.1 hypothetical protein [Bacteroidota bacterium]MBT5426181.1 hypothetical protein [Bacteroidota bacterium]
MTSNKDKSLKEIFQLFEATSNLVLSQLDILIKAIKEDNRSGISEAQLEILNTRENEIDGNEIKFDSLIIQTIVLYKPVASDLRQLFAIYRMINNLERIGDLSLKIADILLEIQDSEFFQIISPLFRKMLKQACNMVQDALLSFINRDVELAFSTIREDKEIELLNKKFLRHSIKKAEGLIEANEFILLAEMRSILSSFERIGDHATNIAEASVYALSGSNIKHQEISRSKKMAILKRKSGK